MCCDHRNKHALNLPLRQMLLFNYATSFVKNLRKSTGFLINTVTKKAVTGSLESPTSLNFTILP